MPRWTVRFFLLVVNEHLCLELAHLIRISNHAVATEGRKNTRNESQHKTIMGRRDSSSTGNKWPIHANWVMVQPLCHRQYLQCLQGLATCLCAKLNSGSGLIVLSIQDAFARGSENTCLMTKLSGTNKHNTHTKQHTRTHTHPQHTHTHHESCELAHSPEANGNS